KSILNALSENGYADLAYTVATQESFPSWGWWMVNGATTLFENWPIDAKRDLSMNHIMFGEISAWFYKALGGIFPDETQPGFKNIILKPNFVAGLERFKATHNSPYGTIVSSWEKNGQTISYNVTIPANSTAELTIQANRILENGKELSENKFIQVERKNNKIFTLQLKPGRYTFSVETKK
ncbi:MAG: alpha-L-rhamnosidase C-terminal domain-containing protein, partial [Mariniphaga sp.]|nr:alpha-L-rhamnosidase C-terminal domain-containing protein [Mariniphaga sp.]